ncbi:cation:proton antiporter [Psychrosphaera sp. B3R10]|uniref:cation:proton antiporter n=1 Tax=unclassified Psychrosphaera TaxID=2641570 RepID=UPI001C08400F|nr:MULTISPECIES: sodium:proton antiporter [unclassified Psychrosphaera]MBU2882459.1 cation:proton antiporter [Psychrosphaera sp. I2R16]MBU2990280.1 cation:proton antiporter [Psychrosphaera sp. B3R10]MDO6721278.1 sodium:proton antiporter [Psychrosphaera sp. 1_MG-2023]
MDFEPISLLVLIGILSISCQLFAHKLKIPAILPLLLIGLMVGPVFGQLNSEQLFGDLLFPMVSLSVAIILFEGALSLNFSELGSQGKVVRNLCTIGTLVNWLVVAPVAHFVLGISWQIAFLFSAIVTVTGPTVIVPMLRTVRPSKNVAQILKWEGIIIDPIGAILAVLTFEYIISTQNAIQHTLVAFGKTVSVGVICGALFGHLLSVTLKRGLIPEYLINTAVFTFVLGAFQLSNVAAHESGLLTVTIMGIWLANKKDVSINSIIEFKETLSVLLISGLFIILAARVDLAQLADISVNSTVLLLCMIFVARPIGVYLSTMSSSLRWQEKALISWIAPRGIVAAAVSALFSIKLEQNGMDEASILASLVFFVIIFTVVLQSLTAKPIAKMLGEREPAPLGFLIFGGNHFARLLAKELMQTGLQVKIADTNWEAISAARMEGIPTYFGNPSSEHAQRTMDLTGIGNLLVLSPHKQMNSLVTQYYQFLFGEEHVAGLGATDKKEFEGHLPTEKYMKSLGLFNNVSYSKLASMSSQGASLKKTSITAEFSWEDYKKKYENRYTPLFMFDEKNHVKLVTKETTYSEDKIKGIVSLIKPETPVSE